MDSEVLRQALASICKENENSDPLADLRRGVLALRLLAQLLGALGTTPFVKLTSPSPLLRRTESLLESPECDSLKLAVVAEHLGLHTDHLSGRLRMETGFSISQLRNRARLVRGKRALQNFDTVAKAAAACGFADPNYFARCFCR